MNADEFAKAVRSGDARLRVDRVVVTAGTTKFRGAGLLRISKGEMHLDVTLSGTAKAPDEKRTVWNEADFWKLRGVIEHFLPFAATHVSPAERRMSGRTSAVTLNFSTLELVGTRPSAKERKEMLRLLDELQLRHKEAPAPATPPAPARRRERKIAVARFEAVLVDCKSLADNTVTHTVRRNAFLGKTTGWKADTFVARGSDCDVALIQRDGDLHIHFRSKGRYHSRSTTEDFQRFQAVLDAIGFTHGFNPWPYRLQQWRSGILKQDRLTAPARLPKTVHAPFDRTLGHSSAPPPIHLVARFFARRSTLSRKISEFLFIFRQAGEERVHLPVRTLAFCSLFEGLVHLLFNELKLEKKLRKARPDFDAFLTERDRLVATLATKGKAGDLASKRLAGLLAHAEAVRVKDKFYALCEAFGLEASRMKPHYEAWYAERNPLMHGTWHDHDENDFVHQARIAGAINILLLKLMGYSGKVVAVRFGAEPSEAYRTI